MIVNKAVLVFCALFRISVCASEEEIRSYEICHDTICFQELETGDFYKNNEALNLDKKIISFKFSIPITLGDKCSVEGDCYIYVGQIGDAYKISLNGRVLADNISEEPTYSTYSSVFVPMGAFDLEKKYNINFFRFCHLSNYLSDYHHLFQ